MIKASIIVAMSENSCIGKDGKMPWHISEDLKRFKQRTMGSPIIMGRKTFDSVLGYLGKPLPGRTSIVISRSDYQYEGVQVCKDIEAALEHAKSKAAEQNLDEVFIGGGAQIYKITLPYTDRIYLTKVHSSVDGDTFFPALNESEWSETAREDFDGTPSFSILTLERV